MLSTEIAAKLKRRRTKQPTAASHHTNPHKRQNNMVIGLLAITSIPTVIGVGQAVSAQKKQNAAQKESAKFNLTAERLVNGQVVEEEYFVLVDGRVSKSF